jgi:hypothetical protein
MPLGGFQRPIDGRPTLQILALFSYEAEGRVDSFHRIDRDEHLAAILDKETALINAAAEELHGPNH